MSSYRERVRAMPDDKLRQQYGISLFDIELALSTVNGYITHDESERHDTLETEYKRRFCSDGIQSAD